MEQVVVIPTLDPSPQLCGLVERLQAEGFRHIVVVDDGSKPACQPLFSALEAQGASVLHHPENRGKGAALKTALAYAQNRYPGTAAVTVDDDGQHLPHDVRRVCEEALWHPEALVLGCRDFSSPQVPPRSRLGNRFSAAYFRFDTGVTCPDTQTGLRCIPAALIPHALQTEGERYDFEMNLLTRLAKVGVPLRHVPIETVYAPTAGKSHFRTVVDSARIFRKPLRFLASSLSCSVADLALFALMVFLLASSGIEAVFAATITARIASGALNFALNRTWSFRASAGNPALQAVRYGSLFATQMLASATLVSLLSFLPLPLVIVKALVDSTLFIVSYFVQNRWVFAMRRTTPASPHPPIEKEEVPHARAA